MHFVVQNCDVARGSSVIVNEEGKELYKVDGKIKLVSPTRKKFMKDMNGNVIYTIRNKWWSWLIHSAIIKDANGNKYKLKGKMSFKTFAVLIGMGDKYTIARNPKGRGYAILKNDEVYATFNKQGSGIINDRFNVDCEDGVDVAFVAMLIVSFDSIRDAEREDLWKD